MSKKIEFRDAIICDDIREEVGGKSILVGVYSEEVAFQSYPRNIKLKLYVTFRAVKSKSEIQFRAVLGGVPQPAFASGLVEVMVDNLNNLTQGMSIPGPLIEIERPLILSFEGCVDSGDWVPLSAVKLIEAPQLPGSSSVEKSV